jgi:hypothetical protein
MLVQVSQNHRLHSFECVLKKVIFGTGQYFKWIEGFTTENNFIGINLILSQNR